MLYKKKWNDPQKNNGVPTDEAGMHVMDIELETDYRLFCLFNRFSKLTGAVLRMEPAYQDVLLLKLNIEPPKSVDLSHFCDFLRYIHSCKDAFTAVAVKKAYDKYVKRYFNGRQVRRQTKTISVKKHRKLSREKLGK